MGTRADFFVGIGPTAEWVGSISYDGGPRENGAEPLAATSEGAFRAAVEKLLSSGTLATRPEEGWPWPWEDFRTSDYGYAWDPERGAVVASSGRAWVTAQQLHADPDVIHMGERLRDEEVRDMRDHPKADVAAKSGLLFLVLRERSRPTDDDPEYRIASGSPTTSIAARSAA